MTTAVCVLLAALESTCVPINCDMLWVTLPNGKSDFFLRDSQDASVFAGPEPWYAVVRPELRMVNVATKPAYKGRACEYGFVDGYLRFASEGGKDRTVDVPKPPKPSGTARGFWPTAATIEELRQKNDMWKGGGRLRFISRNPNRTALFLAQLCLVAFSVALFGCGKRDATSKGLGVGQVHGILWTLIFLVLQFQALSRGGILAFLVGAIVVVYFRWRGRWSVKRCVCAVVGTILLAGSCLFVYRNRLTQEVSSEGSQSRTAIWREVPRMIAAAPFGWGLWASGEAYNSWFEKPERCHMIGDLFNDHLSRFVEGGFVWGGLYVFAWCFVFCLGWRGAWQGVSPVFLAVWLAYFVAASFNPMEYWAKSFWVPGVVSAVWLCTAARRHVFTRSICLLSLGLTAGVLLLFGGIAWCAPEQDVPLRVSALGRRILIGAGEPQVWVADDGFVLNGNFNGYPGREIRAYWPKHPKSESLGLVAHVRDLPHEIDRLVLTGTCGEDFLKMANPPKARHIVFLTPPFSSERIPEALRKTCDVHLVTGHFVARLTGDDVRCESWIHIMPGAQVYVPNWLDIVLKERVDAS